MGSQFVDFNADGHLDIITATYDGSPYVSYGSAKGFKEPGHILDAKGERIMFVQHWKYNADGSGEWVDTGQDHCVSAVAFDWDNDGDYDLLLGSYDGQLFRQMNEGTKKEHKFTGKNIPIKADGKPLKNEGGMTAPQLIDWNGDGLMDLVCGSFGGQFGNGPGGAVYLYLNTGAIGAPQFAGAETLIAPNADKAKVFSQPNEGLYANAVDFNGDGALDLVVGAYCNYTPETRKLTPKEEARILELEKQSRENNKSFSEFMDKAMKGIDVRSEEYRQAMDKLFASDEYKQLSEKMISIQQELSQLRPGSKREAAVWFYERKK